MLHSNLQSSLPRYVRPLLSSNERVYSSADTALASGACEVASATLPHENAVIARAFESVAVVDGVFAAKDEEGVWQVYTVVRDHSDEAYEQVLAAESAILARLQNVGLSFHIFAHQGRSPHKCVPVRSEPLFLR